MVQVSEFSLYQTCTNLYHLAGFSKFAAKYHVNEVVNRMAKKKKKSLLKILFGGTVLGLCKVILNEPPTQRQIIEKQRRRRKRIGWM